MPVERRKLGAEGRLLANRPGITRLIELERHFAERTRKLYSESSKRVTQKDYLKDIGRGPFVLAAKLAEKKPVVLLDTGGTRKSARAVAKLIGRTKHQVTIINVNYAHEGNEFVEEFSGHKIVTVRGSAMQLPLLEGTADLALSRSTAAHVPDKLRLVSEAYRALKEGGKAFIDLAPRSALAYHISITGGKRSKRSTREPAVVARKIAEASSGRITVHARVPTTLVLSKKGNLNLPFGLTSVREAEGELGSLPIATYRQIPRGKIR